MSFTNGCLIKDHGKKL